MEPSHIGFVDSTHDALLIFEAVKQCQLDRITRRLQEKERTLNGLKDEHESRIKRWTDGRMWSPSRILGNFLVYRELDKTGQSSSDDSTLANQLSAADQERLFGGAADSALVEKRRERSLVGSLTSTFKFKKDGLVKKTISIGSLHMICYYRVNDVLEGRLRTPSSLNEFRVFSISPEYLQNPGFRVAPKLEYGPDGVPQFVAERDDAPKASTSRSTYAVVPPPPIDTSSLVLQSTYGSDYVPFPFEEPPLASPSSSSSGRRASSNEMNSNLPSPLYENGPTSIPRNVSYGVVRQPARPRPSPYARNFEESQSWQTHRTAGSHSSMTDNGYPFGPPSATLPPNSFQQLSFQPEGDRIPTAVHVQSSFHEQRPYSSHETNSPTFGVSTDLNRSHSDQGHSQAAPYSSSSLSQAIYSEQSRWHEAPPDRPGNVLIDCNYSGSKPNTFPQQRPRTAQETSSLRSSSQEGSYPRYQPSNYELYMFSNPTHDRQQSSSASSPFMYDANKPRLPSLTIPRPQLPTQDHRSLWQPHPSGLVSPHQMEADVRYPVSSYPAQVPLSSSLPNSARLYRQEEAPVWPRSQYDI